MVVNAITLTIPASTFLMKGMERRGTSMIQGSEILPDATGDNIAYQNVDFNEGNGSTEEDDDFSQSPSMK